jgi:hypothetical protein
MNVLPTGQGVKAQTSPLGRIFRSTQKERAMTSPVAINFNNCTFTSNESTIAIGNGSIALGGPNQVKLVGTFSFSTLNISSVQMQFYNNSAGGTVNGVVNIPISPNGTAALTVNNFVGQASVTWNDGGFAVLAPSQPVILNGLI